MFSRLIHCVVETLCFSLKVNRPLPCLTNLMGHEQKKVENPCLNTFSAIGRSGTSLEKMRRVRLDVPERLCNSCNTFGAKNVLKRLFSERHWSVYVRMSQDILNTRLCKGFEGSQMLSFDDRRKE